MSCSMTIDAVRNRTKTVTRRHVNTWRTLKPGDRLALIEKGMGLAKGEKQVVLAEVEIVSVRVEALARITVAECVAEGLPHLTPDGFVRMWCASHGYKSTPLRDVLRGNVECRRIEWRYLDGGQP